MNTNRLPLRDRFDRHVVRDRSPQGCWLWTGAAMSNGYGKFAMPKGSSHAKPWAARLAHRVAYEIAVGEIPDGLEVLHRCDVRNCVNPGHLFVGTQKENMADMHAKGRGVRGERMPTARITNLNAALIRLLADCGVRQHRLASLFGVSAATVSRVALRRSWAHVPDLQMPEAIQ